MDSFLKTLPWEAQSFIYILSALVVALLLLKIPDRVLEIIGTVRFRWRGKWRYPFSANGISLIRVPITLFGAYLVYSGTAHYGGVMTTLAGFILDRMDGKMASILQAYKERVNDPSIPGRTPYGKVVDPVADKGCILPMLWYEFASGYITSLADLVIMTWFEVVGTLVRPPFINRKWRNRTYRWVVVRLRRRLRDPKATGFGKAKMAMQVVTFLLILPYRLEWWDGDRSWITWVVTAVTVLAGLSVLFRFKYHKYIDESIISPLDEFFAHTTNGKNGQGNGTGNGKKA